MTFTRPCTRLWGPVRVDLLRFPLHLMKWRVDATLERAVCDRHLRVRAARKIVGSCTFVMTSRDANRGSSQRTPSNSSTMASSSRRSHRIREEDRLSTEVFHSIRRPRWRIGWATSLARTCPPYCTSPRPSSKRIASVPTSSSRSTPTHGRHVWPSVGQPPSRGELRPLWGREGTTALAVGVRVAG